MIVWLYLDGLLRIYTVDDDDEEEEEKLPTSQRSSRTAKAAAAAHVAALDLERSLAADHDHEHSKNNEDKAAADIANQTKMPLSSESKEVRIHFADPVPQ